ncbi:MAG: LamG domain-containing protein, partial [Thermoguttaceae bacterium]|nr:LamG domain-containing protein [Thermoguttaceae bacterium]
SGIELYYDAGKKVLQLWAKVGSEYVVLDAPIKIGQYVSACGTFDGKTAVFYIDGKEVARKDRKGALVHPDQNGARAFCFGSDVTVDGGELFFKGKLASAKLYTWALTPEQVANVSSN